MKLVSDTTILILAGEVVLLLLAIIGFAAVWFYRQSKLDRNALTGLVRQIKSGEAERKDELKTQIASDYQFEGEELRNAVGEVVEKERDIYRAMVGIYQNRDHSRMKNFTATVEALVSLTLGMVPKTNDEAYEKAVATLREERDRLESELEHIKEISANLMEEYTRAFEKEKVANLESEKQAQPAPEPQSIPEPEEEADIELETLDDSAPSAQSQMLDTLAQLDAALDVMDDEPVETEQPLPVDAPLPLDDDWDSAILADPVGATSAAPAEERATGT